MAKYVDDHYDHLISDIEKIRVRHRQYISYSNEKGAESVAKEMLYNGLDECKNPKSPGNKITNTFDERTGFLTVSDNGRGIPTNILEELFTSLNMGSNINTSNKASLKTDNLGKNGTGTLAICGLAERVEITSYRGGTENIFKTIIFEEGVKVSEETGKCPADKHGLTISYKPSKVMGKNTRIIWRDYENELKNLQYLNKKKIDITSTYIDENGIIEEVKYKQSPFEDILLRNNKDDIMSSRISITIDGDDINEELDGINVKRFISMDIAFVYTKSLNPYIDSFSNSSNTVDNGDHLDGALEAICRLFQSLTKNSLGEKEKSTLDIKWEDVKTGLSIVVALRTNYERLYTGQTKHKVVNAEIKKIITTLTTETLIKYLEKNPTKLKEMIQIIKMNARARREGDKVRTAVVKGSLTNWSSYKMKNYDPCTRKGVKEYKELFIIEGDSAKGSLKLARYPEFQALFAIRGVSANVYKMSLDQIVGPKGNKEFTDLITVMGCNVGSKFDINKLQFSKIIITSDADIDGLFIRSLLMAFFFRLFPEIIMAGMLFIAEPPLYRVNDKKDPFVINKIDYINRYLKSVSKNYKLGYPDDKMVTVYMSKDMLKEFLSDTTNYVDDIASNGEHYKLSERLLEFIIEEFAMMKFDDSIHPISYWIENVNIQHLIDRINTEFPEIYYDDGNKLIKGAVSATAIQAVELSESFVKRISPLIYVVKKWIHGDNYMVLKNISNGSEYNLSMLGILKMLKKYKPDIVHRFKGLGENNEDDIRKTIMDPNTRMLIRVNITDIENDTRIFQMLRGESSYDAQCRKEMMKNYKIPFDMIDT